MLEDRGAGVARYRAIEMVPCSSGVALRYREIRMLRYRSGMGFQRRGTMTS
ncbi:MAG TPA: hypothetical protein VKP69_31715 [Isosphaeraceae bacterium]|nr:hypothetical protein [Isosphaeraceae bacterium]